MVNTVSNLQRTFNQILGQYYATPHHTQNQVNPERWYLAADTLGIIILQDMIQHYGDGASVPDPDLYWQDLYAMMTNL